MQLSKVVTEKSADLIAFAKQELKDKVPANIDSMERGDLVLLVKGILEKQGAETQEAPRAEPASPTAPAAVPGGSDAIQTDQDALTALKIMGFDSRDQVKAYLKGVEREKENAVKRLGIIEQSQKDLDVREAKLKVRERDIDAKGKKVLEDLEKLREVRENNAQLLRQREAISKL